MLTKNITLLLFVLFTSCTPSWFMKSEGDKLNEYFERVYEQGVERYPTWQTYLGRKTNYGKLDNETFSYYEQDHKLDIQNLKELKKFDVTKLNKADRLSHELFKYNLELSIESYGWMFHHFPLNQMFGFQSEIPAFLINMHSIDSKKDAQDYISRLKEIGRVIPEKMEFLYKQEKLKIYPPRFIFDKVIGDSKNIISGMPFDKSNKDSSIFQDFKTKVAKLKLSKNTADDLISSASASLIKDVKPAYETLITYIKKLKVKAKTNKGAWSLPDGEKYYKFKLKGRTTTDLTPDQVHNIGLSEVKRIHLEMKEITKTVNFKGSLKSFFKYMKGDRFLYPQTEKGREAYLIKAKDIIGTMKKNLPKLFNIFPKADLIVKPVESFREKSAGIAFYTGPAMQGNRPGTYYVNLYKMEDNPKYKMEALAYHEGIPGHHMQIAIARELTGLPTFRKTSGFTAYTEGWGLYAELLPKEIGFYQDPYSDFGRLSMELWRATRLVVDTGIHAKRWSREKSIKYLKSNTPNSDLEIIKGVERYFIMPAQATSYKIGMLKILELRKRAKDKLKEKFDIRDFHSIVLKDGALPLSILERKVNDWIQSKGL